MFVRPDILRRIEASGELDRIKQAQMRILTSLGRSQAVALSKTGGSGWRKASKPTEFLADARKGIWKELDSPTVKIDVYRRNLQRGYIDLISQKLNGRAAQNDDERPLLCGEKAFSASARNCACRRSKKENSLNKEISQLACPGPR